MAEDLRHRYAEAIRGCGPLTVTQVLYAVMAVRDEELVHLRKKEALQREELLRYRMNAETDICVGCMEREHQRDRWAEASRQNGVKYEAAKQRWYESKDQAEDAEARLARVRALANELKAEAEQGAKTSVLDSQVAAWKGSAHAADLLLAALDDTAGTENG